MKTNGKPKGHFFNQDRRENDRNQGELFSNEVRADHADRRSSSDNAIGIIVAMFGGTVIENGIPGKPSPQSSGRGTAGLRLPELIINAQGGAVESLSRFSSTPLYKLCEL